MRPLLDMFEVDVVCNGVEIRRGVAGVDESFLHLSGDAVHRLVGEVFGGGALAPCEESDQAAADFLIPLRGLPTIWIEPTQQRVESLLR